MAEDLLVAQEFLEHETMMLLTDLEADGLREVCGICSVDVPIEITGKNALLKLLLKHLVTIQDTETSAAQYTLIHGHLLKKKVGDGVASGEKPAVKTEMPDLEGQHLGSGAVKAETLVDMYKLKDLKISGIIGGIGEKDKLSYLSLSYQIENAKKLGYSEEKICGAVIKAIAPNNHLRTYFESRPGLKLSSVQEILRSHFKEKDSAATFTELGNAKQLGTESCLDFVLRIMCLRQKVLQLSIEEGCAYNEKLLTKRFHQCMFSGIKNQNIRAELRENVPIGSRIEDEILIKMLSDAVLNETERDEKFSIKPSVKSIESSENSNKGNREKKSSLPDQIEEMKLSHQREMSALRADLNEIKTAILGKPGAHAQNSQRIDNVVRNRRKRCQNCEQKNWFRCVHCFVCGESDHRMNVCPNKQPPLN